MSCPKLFIGILLGLGLFAAGHSGAHTLYGADGAGGDLSNLYLLDPVNGAIMNIIGPIGFAITGLAIDPFTGVLYGATARKDLNAPGSLVLINKITGAGTVVGFFTSDGQTMADVTFCRQGTLYGWLEPFSDDLYKINPATGAATLIGNSGLDTYGSGLACSPSGMLFLASDGSNGPLRTVNPTSGVATVAATLTGSPGEPFAPVAALAFDPDETLYGVVKEIDPSFVAYLVKIDPTTGTVANLGQTVDRLDSIVFEPGPPSRVPMISGNAVWLCVGLLLGGGIILSRRLQRN